MSNRERRRAEGRRLRDIRCRSGWTVLQLAHWASLSCKQVHDIEDGQMFIGRAKAAEDVAYWLGDA